MLRPAYLQHAREEWQAGRLPTADFKRKEDRAVDEAIAIQEGAGLDIVTDGEMRRVVFFDQFISSVEGLSAQPAATVHFHGATPEEDVDWVVPFAVTGRLRSVRSPAAEEYAYVRARARARVKVTLPSPLLLAAFWSDAAREVYSDPFELFEDGAAIVNTWARELAAMGCELIQFDAPELAEAFADEGNRSQLASQGVDMRRFLNEGIDYINAAADVAGVTRVMHLCKGNYRSKWIARGGYDELSKVVFQRATNIDVFHMEYDDDRSGSFEPLRNLSDDKRAVLGLVSTKHNHLEAVDTLAARIADAARHASLDRLGVATQCGFASDASGNLISEETQAAKLGLVARTAEQVWG
jgi:5-methyltetrahydropteroyltriglutamate--homocysteine methyltransferase